MIQVYLGLGSNLGDRSKNIQDAIKNLSFIKNIRISNFYESPALLPDDHDPSWDINFINCAISGEYYGDHKELLRQIKTIERDMGRDPNQKRWAPRVIDIDIIFFGDEIINDDAISIPHPEMHKRSFVILPLNDLAPKKIHPALNKSINQLKLELDLAGINSQTTKIT